MKPKPPSDPAALRRAAEAVLNERATPRPRQTEADLRRIQHELEVHMIELEMQNDELRTGRAEIEAGLERYKDLYDFAPVGYLTLDRSGAIQAANLTAARLLGAERASLVRRSLATRLAEKDRPVFRAFLEQTFTSGTREICEVQLPREGATPLFVRMEALVSGDGLECRAAVLDVSDRHRAEVERDRVIEELQKALARVRQLTGLLPICASCKQIRDDQGYWSAFEVYIRDHSEATFTHGICPACVAKTWEQMNQ